MGVEFAKIEFMENSYPRGVEVVASPLIVNKEKKLLLIKSHKWGDNYLIPGGHVEPTETVESAAKREGEEETGLKLKPLYCVNIGELINSPTFNRRAHLIFFHYVCEALSEEINLDDKELKEHIWVEPSQALEMNITKGAKQTIKNYIDRIKFDVTSRVFD